MSLQFVMGPSGSGKSHYLYQWVTDEAAKNPNKNYLVLVPDQFTMQTQRDLVMANPQKGILNVDVLSFNRLAYRVFEETGDNERIVLNDIGKSFVLRKIAGDCEQDLKVLRSNLKKTGFIGEMKSILSEFTQYDIQSNALDDMLSKIGSESGFYYKLKDIQTIYEGFQAYLKDKYITNEEILDILCAAVPKSKLLKDSVVVLDGFTGFSPVQNRLLGELMCVCEKIVVTVTIGEHQRSNPLFDLSEKTIEVLSTTAKENRVEIETPVELSKKPVYRFQGNVPLAFLESHLFRYSKEKYEKEQESIRVFHAKNPREEVDFVAQNIRRIVRTEGVRYREIAVIASDMNAYANHVENVFAKYDIPVFMDHKRSILLNSFVEYLRSLLEMAEQNFTYESVFRYLRTNLTGFTIEEVDKLENYCIALGIRGYSKWKEKWIRRMKDMEEPELAEINRIRERFVQNIEAVMTVLKRCSKTVLDITKALHEYLLENQLQKKVKEYEVMFAEAGELALEKEYAQVYRIVMDLFDQFVELLGDEKIALKEYCELLDAGLEEAKVGIIPPSLDQVVIGDIERTRITDVKYLFFMGVNDNYIPGKAKANGLLSERDREKLTVNGMTLAPSAKEKAFIQKFYLYLILTKPSKQILLSFSKTSSEGKAIRPAYLIMDLMKMFPQLQVQAALRPMCEQELTGKSSVKLLVEGLQKKKEGFSDEWKQLYSWYVSDEAWREQILQMVGASFFQRPRDILSEKAARMLYGDILYNSVTRMEQFSSCAYAYFLTYGLKLKERETYQFQALDLGNLFHSAMERFSEKLTKSGETWLSVSEEERDSLIEESVEESIVDYGNSILYSSARNEYTITRLKRLVRRSIWAITKQLEQGDFVPKGYEVVYDSGMILLAENKKMRLHGKIDRVDICETEDQVFVKVVDYKTGTKEFDLGEVYHGLQLQLILYMNAAMEMEKKRAAGKEVIPAGLFYYKMQDPVIAKVDNEEEREELLLKALRMDGMVNESEDVLSHLERDGWTKSWAIPVDKKKDGGLSKNSKVLLPEDLKVVSQFAAEKMRSIGNRIMQGEISVSPYEAAEHTPCKYCAYKSVCGFDEKIAGYEYRKLKKFETKEEIIESMKKEVPSWE